MQCHFSYVMRCVTIVNIYYYECSQWLDAKTADLEVHKLVYNVRRLHWPHISDAF